VYDPAINKILWSTGINYEKGGVDQFKDLIIKINQYEGFYFLDLKNGKSLWETKKSFYHSDPVKRIGITYNSKIKEPNGTVVGVDLISGKEIWTRQLNHESTWYETLELNDSVMAVVTSGLHTINLYTGVGWDYDFQAKGKSKQHISSNIIFQDSRFYNASKERLFCLDEAGKLIWSIDLPVDLTSISHLFIKNGILYLVNRGLIYSGLSQVLYGKPFFAGYDLKDGHQKFYSEIAKKDFISSMEIEDQNISMMLGNTVMKYSLNNGQLITLKSYDLNENEALRNFVGGFSVAKGSSTFFQTSDSTFHNLMLSDTTKQFVITTKQRVLILDDQLKIAGQLAYEDLYVHFGSFEGFKFFCNGKNVNNTIITDEKNKPIAEIEASYSAILLNKILYDSNQKKFIEIDLSGVLKK